MHSIDGVNIQYEIGYGFPIRTWNIGMDNARLCTVPEPTAGLILVAGSLLIARLRRR